VTGPDAPNPDADDVRGQFEAMIADMDPAKLPTLLNELTRAATNRDLQPPPPSFRKPPLSETVVFRIRIDLDGARPPIWRRLDVRSNVTLDEVHRSIQVAFGWLDYHLYRFALGGNPFDRRSEMFLCPFDVAEGEESGTPIAEVRLDETMHDRGDALRYVYDYGDNWGLTLRLESVHDATATTPPVRCVGGRRAAPPEDCGGLTDAESLAEVLDDPDHFDIDEVNSALSDPIRLLPDAGIDERLAELLYRLGPGDTPGTLTARAAALLEPAAPVPTEQLATDLRPYLWFLRRARDDGFDLTSAGYLKPADVVAASAVLPSMQNWIGAKNREVQSGPLLHFRENLQRSGLLRKYKGRLLPTRLGKSIADDPQALAEFLAARAVPDGTDRFNAEATLLLLFFAATSQPGDEVPLEVIAGLLTALDWRKTNGAPIKSYDLYHLDSGIYEFFKAISEPVRALQQVRVSASAVAVARLAISQSASNGARA
jgi:hypothetical protein